MLYHISIAGSGPPQLYAVSYDSELRLPAIGSERGLSLTLRVLQETHEVVWDQIRGSYLRYTHTCTSTSKETWKPDMCGGALYTKLWTRQLTLALTLHMCTNLSVHLTPLSGFWGQHWQKGTTGVICYHPGISAGACSWPLTPHIMSNFQAHWSVCAPSEVDWASARWAKLSHTGEYEPHGEGHCFDLYLSEWWQDYVWQNHPRQKAVMTAYKTAMLKRSNCNAGKV